MVPHDSGEPADSARHGGLRSCGLVKKLASCCCCFAAALRVLAASMLSPVVRSGSHTFCLLEPLPNLTGPMAWGTPPRPNFGMETILLCFLPPPGLPLSTPEITHK